MEFALGIGLRQEPAFVKVAKVELAQRLAQFSLPCFSARINSCSMEMGMSLVLSFSANTHTKHTHTHTDTGSSICISILCVCLCTHVGNKTRNGSSNHNSVKIKHNQSRNSFKALSIRNNFANNINYTLLKGPKDNRKKREKGIEIAGTPLMKGLA